jgi:hypothetical protein
MDVEMVAAMLDVKYDKLQQALSSTREGEGLGMHFLDKLVQLPFYLPTLTDGKKQAYLDTLFAAEMEAERGLSQPGPDETVVSPAGKETATKKPGDEDAVTKLIDQVMQKPAADENSPADNVQLLATDKKARQRESFRELLRQSNDTEKIKEQLHEFVRFLGSDPRSIKRFVNLMRFYINQQKVRNEKSELDKTQFKAIAKWVIIMLRYHRLVRWIQWEKETELLQSTMPEDKASFIDITIRDIKGQFPPNEGQATDKAFEAWQSEIFMTQKQHHAVTSSGESVEATGNAPKDEARPADDNGLRQRKAWLADKLLFELLYMHNEEGSELMKALENNIW